MTTSHRWLAVFTGLNAIGAWAGAIGLVVGYLSLGDTINHRLPFASPVFAGFALAVVVALPLSVVTYLAWDRGGATATATTACGVLLVGWIAVQVAIIREFSWFQPFYTVVGAGLVVWGRRHHEPVDESPAERRARHLERLEAAVEDIVETVDPRVTTPTSKRDGGFRD